MGVRTVGLRKVGIQNPVSGKKNTAPSPVIPQLVSAEIPNGGGGDVVGFPLLFSLPLKNDSIPDMSSFVSKVNSVTKEIAFDGFTENDTSFNVYRVDEEFFAYGDVVTISYTQPETNPLQGLDGGLVESFVDYPVTNNIEFTPLALAAKLLFWGKVSDIAAGEMPNLVGEDALTVGGSAGNYTFQCPDTAPYIAADTDFIWFKTDETLRTPTEAELVGYDFLRTLVKYGNTTPYLLAELIILDPTATLTTAEENLLRDYMELSIWWSNVSSDHGMTKGNRNGSQSVWDYMNENKPSGLTVSLISGGVKYDWTDNSGGMAQTEVWCRSNSGAYTTATYTINAGTVTKSETIAPGDLRYCKIRAKIGTNYSDFTAEESIAMLGSELITGWINEIDAGVVYETFTTNGKLITSAINSSAAARCGSSPAFTIVSGEKYYLTLAKVINSGDAYIYLRPLNSLSLASNAVSLSDGDIVTFTATVSINNAVLSFEAGISNFAISAISLKKIL